MDKSNKIFLWLIITLAICGGLNLFLPQGNFVPENYQYPAPKIVIALVNTLLILVVYGGLGFLGLKLSQKLGLPEILDEKITNRQRFIKPIFAASVLAVIFVIVDLILSKFSGLGRFPHPPFPTSVVASISAGIGEELIFRLFYTSFWTWLFSYVILKKKYQNQVYWIFSVLSAIAFSAGHIFSLSIVFQNASINIYSWPILTEIFLLNGILALFAAKYFKQYGILAAIGLHFWLDIFWHVIYGLF